MTFSGGPLSFGLAPPLVLGLTDHRSPTPVRFNNQNLAIFDWSRCLFEERLRLSAQGIDHAERGARARHPLMELLEEIAGRCEGHHRAQPRYHHHGTHAESGAKTQVAIDREVSSATDCT